MLSQARSKSRSSTDPTTEDSCLSLKRQEPTLPSNHTESDTTQLNLSRLGTNENLNGTVSYSKNLPALSGSQLELIIEWANNGRLINYRFHSEIITNTIKIVIQYSVVIKAYLLLSEIQVDLPLIEVLIDTVMVPSHPSNITSFNTSHIVQVLDLYVNQHARADQDTQIVDEDSVLVAHWLCLLSKY